jgi:hypothetical protein
MSTHPTLPAGVNGGQDNSIPLPPLLLRELVEALRSIRFGAVELVIHDGRVVQLERREKVRFDAHGEPSAAPIKQDRPDRRTSATSNTMREIHP